jgi:hypothetical protein
VRFTNADIGGNFQAEGVQCTGNGAGANFTNMRVGGTININHAVFASPLTFSSARIAGSFLANGAQFSGAWADFNGLKAGDLVDIENATFTGPVSFSDADVTGSLLVDGAHYSQLDLSGAHYQDISAGPWKTLSNLIHRSFKFNPEAYTTLEAVFEHQGHPERAFGVYLQQKGRGIGSDSSILTTVFDVLVFIAGWILSFGGNISPNLGAGLLGFIFISFGVIVFREGFMAPTGEKKAQFEYSSLWYSVDLFAPILNLDVASHWVPNEKCRFRCIWWRIQRILGWGLLSVALAVNAFK